MKLLASDYSAARCSFNQRTREASARPSGSLVARQPQCRTNSSCAWATASQRAADWRTELEIRPESRRRRGSSQSQETSHLPNLLHFLPCSLGAAPRRRRRGLTLDNPPLADRASHRHTYTYPPGQARPGGPTQTSHPGGLPSPHQSGLQGGRGRR